MLPIRVTVEGIDDLPVGSTVRVEVTVELGPSSTVSNSTTNMTVNHGATLTAETEIITDDDATVQP